MILLSIFNETKKKQEIILKERTLLNKGEDFKLGAAEDVQINEKNELMLKEKRLQGTYMSPVINANKFRDLVCSWNAETPKGTEIEVFFQVRKEGTWSKWFSYGKWSSYGNRGSIEAQCDDIARMDIDTLTILNGEEADGFRYRITMSRKEKNTKSPKVKAIWAALKAFEKTEQHFNKNKACTVELDVPVRSQMVIPKIGNLICSPTSLAMVMEYYGQKIDTEEVAENVFDYGAKIYGNWSYNVAYAGSKGFTAYVDRFSSIDEIKDKIVMGIPVIASVTTKSKNDLNGAPMAYPSGHLLVVRGFKVKNGEEYVIVNDPASPSHDTVRREYNILEFEKAWRKIVYIVTPDLK